MMKRLVAPATLLCTAILLVHGRVLGNDFIAFDDPLTVTENPDVLAGLSWAGVQWAFTTGHFANWAPLTWLSHQLDVSLFGLWAGGHHATSLLLHVIGSLAILYGFAVALNAPWTAALMAALYALHPLHVESVAWISERKGVLSSAFGLWAIAIYLVQTSRWSGKQERRSVGLAVCLLYAASLLSKQMLVTMPALLLLLDRWPLRRPWSKALLWEKWPLILLSATFAAIAYAAQAGGNAVSSLEEFPLDRRLMNIVLALGGYPGQWLAPTCLGPFYPIREWPTRHDWLPFLIGCGVIGVFAFDAVVSKRSERGSLLGWVWYAVALLPVSGIVPVGRHAHGDRYSDIPLLGIHWQAALLIASALGGPSAVRRAIAVAAIGWLGILAGMSTIQVGHWRDTETLFTHMLSCDPDNYMANNQLGVVRLNQDRNEVALSHFERAIQADPTFVFAHINLGRAHRKMGDLQRSERAFASALQADENCALAWHEHALSLAELGQTEAAALELRRACQLDPRDGQASINLGSLLLRLQQPAEAVALLERGVALKPGSLQGRFDLARACLAINNLPRADALARELADEFPDNPAVLRLVADVAARRGAQPPGKM